MLDAAFFGKFQKPLDWVDIVLLIQVVNGRRTFDALIHACGEDKTFAPFHISAHFVIGHLKVISILDFHFRRKYCARGQGR